MGTSSTLPRLTSPLNTHSTHRRMLISRNSSSSSTPSCSPTRTSSSSLHNIFHPHQQQQSSRSSSPTQNTSLASKLEEREERESDAECWERMLALQMEYHCYNSARLEAAVEAVVAGCPIENVPIPSRLCLDLLNEELIAQIESTERAKLRV